MLHVDLNSTVARQSDRMIEIDPSIAELRKMLKDNKQENLRNKKFHCEFNM